MGGIVVVIIVHEIVQVVRCVRVLDLCGADSPCWHRYGVVRVTANDCDAISLPQVWDATWTLGFVDWKLVAMPQQVVVASGRA